MRRRGYKKFSIGDYIRTYLATEILNALSPDELTLIERCLRQTRLNIARQYADRFQLLITGRVRETVDLGRQIALVMVGLLPLIVFIFGYFGAIQIWSPLSVIFLFVLVPIFVPIFKLWKHIGEHASIVADLDAAFKQQAREALEAFSAPPLDD